MGNTYGIELISFFVAQLIVFLLMGGVHTDYGNYCCEGVFVSANLYTGYPVIFTFFNDFFLITSLLRYDVWGDNFW